MNASDIQTLVQAATPFLRIDGADRIDWMRNVQSGPRRGPWRYRARYTVLNDAVWSRAGEVLYFVTDAAGQLRLVGESGSKLDARWRISPMLDPVTQARVPGRALFHSTAWRAIEAGLDQERAPFTVSALFGDELHRLVRSDWALPDLNGNKRQHLALRVEKAILQRHGLALRLWNRASVS